MGQQTSISWCHHTWNPWRGCDWRRLPDGSIHPGCVNCYAASMSKRNPAVLGVWGSDGGGSGTRVVASESTFMAPIKWNQQAAKDGVRRRVFVNSLSDFWEDWYGPMDRANGVSLMEMGSTTTNTMQFVRARVMCEIVDNCPHLDFIILTKRPENILRVWPDRDHRQFGIGKRFRSNVWLLCSVSDEATSDAISSLMRCRDLSPVLGVSAEPLLGPIDLRLLKYRTTPRLDWVIVGGESGPKRREMPLDAAENVAKQCVDAGVACWVKQDSHLRSEQRGRLSDWMWGLKQLPKGFWR